MIRQPNIQKLLADEAQMKKLLDIRMEEEAGRLDGIPGVSPTRFTFLDTAASDAAVRKAYSVMQAQYVLRPEDRIAYDTAMTALGEIKDHLGKNKAWSQYKPSTKLMLRIKAEEAERLQPAPSNTRKRDDRER